MFPQTRDTIAPLDRAQFAAWLVACPDATIVAECGTLHAAAERHEFPEAARFIEARRAAAWCKRNADLSLPQSVVARVFATLSILSEAAKREGGTHVIR